MAEQAAPPHPLQHLPPLLLRLLPHAGTLINNLYLKNNPCLYSKSSAGIHFGRYKIQKWQK